MRKKDAMEQVAALTAQVAALKAENAALKVMPITKPERAAKDSAVSAEHAAVVITSTVKPKADKKPSKSEAKRVTAQKKSKTAKAKVQPKVEDDTESHIYAVAGDGNPLAAKTSDEIAKEYGSPGYDDMTTPIEDHDRNWANHPRNRKGVDDG